MSVWGYLRTVYPYVFLFVLLLAMFTPSDFQRRHPGIPFAFEILLVVFGLTYFFMQRFVVKRKQKKCIEIIEKLDDVDPEWKLEDITARVQIAFYKLIEAKTTKDFSVMSEYMGDRNFEEFKKFIDKMNEEFYKNIIEKVHLEKLVPIKVEDFTDDSKDKVNYCVMYSMIDYTVDERTGLGVAGDCYDKRNFVELWTMVRTSKGWVLDDIIPDYSINEMVFSQNALFDVKAKKL